MELTIYIKDGFYNRFESCYLINSDAKKYELYENEIYNLLIQFSPLFPFPKILKGSFFENIKILDIIESEGLAGGSSATTTQTILNETHIENLKTKTKTPIRLILYQKGQEIMGNIDKFEVEVDKEKFVEKIYEELIQNKKIIQKSISIIIDEIKTEELQKLPEGMPFNKFDEKRLEIETEIRSIIIENIKEELDVKIGNLRKSIELSKETIGEETEEQYKPPENPFKKQLEEIENIPMDKLGLFFY